MKEKERKPQNLQECTLCFLIKENQILLAMKKRGFGKGKWNGIGGKVKEGENVEQALIRETFEEIGVKPISFKKVAVLDYLFPDAPEDKNWNQQVNVFLVDEWKSEPVESEEMKPEWFAFENLPFEAMWDNDKLWIPRILFGEKLKGEFILDADSGKTIKHSIKKAT